MDICDLRRTADLAGIDLDDEELKIFFPMLTEMLQNLYITNETVNKTFDESTLELKALKAVYLRPDNIKECCSRELLQNAEKRDGSFITIPNLFSKM